MSLLKRHHKVPCEISCTFGLTWPRFSTDCVPTCHLTNSVKALWANQCVNIPRQAANLMIRLNLSQLTAQVAQMNMKQ